MSKPLAQAGPSPLAELPVGPNPDWELEHSDEEDETAERQSIPERWVNPGALNVSELIRQQLCNFTLASTMLVTLYIAIAFELNILCSA